jgi:hypothetical protein
MQTLTQTKQIQSESTVNRSFAVDTTFVLFFLAVEFGQIIGNFGFDTILFGLSLVMLIVLPYFLAYEQNIHFVGWILGRTFIAGFATAIGLLFKQSVGNILPETFRFLPMTLLIITAMLSCYIQFYGLLKLRLAK